MARPDCLATPAGAHETRQINRLSGEATKTGEVSCQWVGWGSSKGISGPSGTDSGPEQEGDPGMGCAGAESREKSEFWGGEATNRPTGQDTSFRCERASDLARAIEACEPADALQLCAGYLEAMRAGMPGANSFVECIRADAAMWAAIATPDELAEIARAALARLRGTALHMRQRKRLLWSLFVGLPVAERRAFVAAIGTRGLG